MGYEAESCQVYLGNWYMRISASTAASKRSSFCNLQYLDGSSSLLQRKLMFSSAPIESSHRLFFPSYIHSAHTQRTWFERFGLRLCVETPFRSHQKSRSKSIRQGLEIKGCGAMGRIATQDSSLPFAIVKAALDVAWPFFNHGQQH